MLEELGWVDEVDEVDDPRPLRRLGVVSGSVLVAVVVLLVHEHRSGTRGLSGGGLFVVWLVAAIAALLLLGAVGGLLARRTAARHPRLDPDELRDRQAVRTLLRRERSLPPELDDAARREVDDIDRRRWTPSGWMVLGLFWTGTAFTSSGGERWFHLVAGAVYLGQAAWTLLDRRRVLRAAARGGIVPGRARGRTG